MSCAPKLTNVEIELCPYPSEKMAEEWAEVWPEAGVHLRSWMGDQLLMCIRQQKRFEETDG